MKNSIVIILLLVSFNSFTQTNQKNYENALAKLSCMLSETCKLSFKEAVFVVENTYFDNELDKTLFDKEIKQLANLCRGFMKSRKLFYNEEDKEQVMKYASLFSVLKDTLPIQIDSNLVAYHYPYTYDFNDIWGANNWSNMFVSKLLVTKKGNCHSLPYLYKIVAEEIGATAYIAVAPNHFYIKYRNKLDGWYNTELTSGIFPIDGWLMASGYIHLDAIVNKLYMEALDRKQSIALCIIDLAKGYERKIGNEASINFMLNCCDTALKYYPNYINALLLKTELKNKQFKVIMKNYSATYASEILDLPEAKKIFTEMTKLCALTHKLGYRKMPKEMYLNWLTSLKNEKNKYENTKVVH